jgi:hypothetical protein
MKKIILWGAGGRGIKLLFRLQKDHQEVEYVVDSNLGSTEIVGGGDLQGIPIRTDLSFIKNIKDYYIVVATVEEPYLEIRDILLGMGLQEFEDFIWGDLYKKSVVVINANCHERTLKRYLLQSKQFQMNYGIYPLPEIPSNQKGYIDDRVLAHADVLIYQDIRSGNKISYKLSYEYILKRVRPDCKTICIPNMVGNGNGFFPTQTKGIYSHKLSKYDLPFFFRDTLIDEAWKLSETKSIDDIVQYIESYKFDADEIKTGFYSMMEKIRARENMWDVKVADFIECNYRYVPMMNDKDHPADALMQEIGRQVAQILGLSDTAECHWNVLGIEAFIWPGIKKILGIEYKTEEVRILDTPAHILGNEHSLTLREYIQEYVWCFHNEIIE